MPHATRILGYSDTRIPGHLPLATRGPLKPINAVANVIILASYWVKMVGFLGSRVGGLLVVVVVVESL